MIDMKKVLYVNLVLVLILLLSFTYVSIATPVGGTIIGRTWMSTTYHMEGDTRVVYHNLPAMIVFITIFVNLYFIVRNASTGLDD